MYFSRKDGIIKSESKLNKNTDEIIFTCKECDWEIPEDLIKRLIDGETGFCEKCGLRIFKKDYNFHELTRKKQSDLIKNRVNIIKSKGKKAYKRVQSKLKDMKDKYQNH